VIQLFISTTGFVKQAFHIMPLRYDLLNMDFIKHFWNRDTVRCRRLQTYFYL